MARRVGYRAVRLPAGDLHERPVPVAETKACDFWRVHATKDAPCYFSKNRDHRFSPPDGPWPLLYLADSIETCLLERFGDELYEGERALAACIWRSRSVSRIRVPALRICDLTDAKTCAALGVDAGALCANDLAIPQAWSLGLQLHPARFDGLRYRSRFGKGACLALFGRPPVERRLRVEKTVPLADCADGDAFLDAFRVALV